jgi:hypothetical protein
VYVIQSDKKTFKPPHIASTQRRPAKVTWLRQIARLEISSTTIDRGFQHVAGLQRQDLLAAAAGCGEQLADVALAHAEHVGGFGAADSVAIGEHQNLLMHGIVLRERALKVHYPDVAAVRAVLSTQALCAFQKRLLDQGLLALHQCAVS